MRYVFIVVEIFGSICASIGLLSTLGYITDQRFLYEWIPGSSGMALNTSVAFIFQGLSTFIIGFYFNRNIFKK